MVDDISVRHLALQLNILSELGHSLPPGTSVLDFGCGEGKMVSAYRAAGYVAFGCDLKLEKETDFVRLIPESDFRVPFPDSSFDFIYSDQVLEHVKDLSRVVAEIYRVLKPGAISLHIFPAKLKTIEAHTFVPLAGVFQNYYWLMLWAFLGVRNSFQKEKSAREVARLNYDYLQARTRYLSKSEIVRAVSSHFTDFAFAERQMIKHSYGNARHIYPLVKWAPFVATLYSNFYSRVIFLQKPAAVTA